MSTNLVKRSGDLYEETTLDIIEDRKTERGFGIIEFKDFNGETCSLQESSLATEAAIWFGPDDANPKLLTPHKGWASVPFPKDTLFTTRMHLTQKQVKQLLPYLKHFAKTGYLPSKEKK